MATDRLTDLVAKLGLTNQDVDELQTLLGAVAGAGHTLDGVLDAVPADEQPTTADPPTEGPAPRPALARSGASDAHLELLEPIGQGGMGSVHRVRDRDLDRTMALKAVHAEFLDRNDVLARFIEEAQVTAQLQHPGIVPVHMLGQLEDGRTFFTMREVEGQTLTQAILQMERPQRGSTPGGRWTLRRLMDVFHKICTTIAYAHSRGVVHRDLKPDNIMLGAYGEVLVVDWGLAKVLGQPGVRDAQVQTRRSAGSLATRMGAVAGTPRYMSPEQARGDVHAIDEGWDVYALGAVLYQILSGAPPYADVSPDSVVDAVLMGPPAPIGQAHSKMETAEGSLPMAVGPRIPPELVVICERAMAHDPSARHPSATAVADEVLAWLEGVKQSERAMEVVEAAEEVGEEGELLRIRAAQLRRRAARTLRGLSATSPEAQKAPAWALQDEARHMELQAGLKKLERERGLHAAFTHLPGLPAAHAALAETYLAEHQAAEQRGDLPEISRTEILLRLHAGALPAGHAARRRCGDYLEGDGALSLATDPPGASVSLYRYQLENRRLAPVHHQELGVTPLRRIPVPMGSWLAIIRHDDRPDVRYPFSISRRQHHTGRPPRTSEPHPVHLPAAEGLGPDDCYVPAGFYHCGGDPKAIRSLPTQRLWVDGFVARRFPVTNREYIAFLDDLASSGREEEALLAVPRERGGHQGEQGAMIYGRGPTGRFELRPDADGDVWDPEFPVCMIDALGAQAYADWLAVKTGLPWRLPSEFEWEKAARGGDRRTFPWGDFVDPTWCCYELSHDGHPLPAVVDSFPRDVSPYGIRGMGGNMREWCANAFEVREPEGDRVVVPPRVKAGKHVTVRGGYWFAGADAIRVAQRDRVLPAMVDSMVGMRLYRSI